VQEAREWSEKILPTLPSLYLFLENERKEKNSLSINAPVQNGPALATEGPTLSEASKHSAAGRTLFEALKHSTADNPPKLSKFTNKETSQALSWCVNQVGVPTKKILKIL